MLTMAQKQQKHATPRSHGPKNALVSFRVDDRTVKGLEKMREKMGVISFSMSDVAREMVLRMLKENGFYE